MKRTISPVVILGLGIFLFFISPLPVQGQGMKEAVGSDLTHEESRLILDLHNQFRAEVGVPPLRWSETIAKVAQEWASRLTKTCRMAHRPDSGPWARLYGENLFQGAGTHFTVGEAVRTWGREKALYKGFVLDASNWRPSGHYTQMVWSATTRLGCAKAECNGDIIVVCNYDPPGNVMGQKPF